MFALNCSGLLDETSKWCEAIKLEDDDVIPSSVVCSYHEKSHIAVASETVLTVAMSSIGKKFVNCFDLEIDHSIEVICWGVDASCLIAGDSCGSLHFITPMGELLFSHRILLKNEKSRFVHLGFAGRGNIHSLVAVFENGKVFGIEDFSAERICSLALNEPNSLSVAMRKMKFLKSSLAVDHPLSKAVVYIGTSGSGCFDSSVRSETTGVDIPLSITLMVSTGDLLTSSIGCTTALQNATPTSILKALRKGPSNVNTTNCVDMVLVPFHETESDNGSACGILAALHVDNSLSIIDLSSNIIIRRIRFDADYFSTRRISLVCSVPMPETCSGGGLEQESEWCGIIIGFEISGKAGTHTELSSIIRNRKTKNTIVAVKLGTCDELSENLILSSPPAAIVFQAGRKNCSGNTVDTGGCTTGYALTDSVFSLVRSIIKGIEVEDVQHDDSLASPAVTIDGGCTAVQVLIGRMVRLSIEATAGAGGGEDGEESTSKNHLLNPFGAEELFDQALGMMASVNTCAEVFVILNAVIVCVSDPAAGFIDRAIKTAESSIGAITSGQIVSNSNEYSRSLEDLKRCVETARNLSSRFPLINSATHIGVAQHTSGEDAPTLSVEETARQRIVQLTGNSLCGASVCSQRDPLSERHKYMYTVHADLWTECVTAGALRDASLIMSRHLSDALSADSGSSFLSSSAMISAFKSIPESVPPSDIVVWFRSDVLPRLHRWAEDPAFQMSGTGTLGALLVAELCRRASLSADLLFHPFEAILAADLAVTLSSSFTHTGEVDTAQGLNSDKIIDIQSRTLLLNLQIQAAVWRNWGDRNRPSILDVADLGLRGLVRERLWDLRDIEEEIVSDVTYVIEPVLVEFGERLDDVLQQWLQDAVEQRVVLIDGNAGTRAIQGNSDRGRDRVRDSRGIASNAHDQEDDEEDTTCSLSRLVSVVSLIKDPHRRVTSLLLLFQVPAVDVNEERPVAVQQSDSPLSNNSASDDPRGHSEGTIDRLCALAQAVCPLVEPVSSEALREAMRLHRIKTLAASYGVVSFDPRDRHQIRAVASVIALKAERTHALRDAMEFASSWGTDSADLSGLLTRAIVHRATSACPLLADDAFDEAAHRDQCIQSALVQVPPHRFLAVVEDACSYLAGALEDICEDSITAGKLVGSLSTPEDEVQAALLVRSLICITSTYLDKVRDGEATQSGLQRKGDKPSEYAARGSTSISSVNADLLSSAKRLRLLQSEERIFLSLAGLRDSVGCNAAAAQIAEERSDSMISFASATTANSSSVNGKTTPYTNQDGVGSAQMDSDVTESAKRGQMSALTPEIRRLCALLGVSPFQFAHTVMKRLIAKGASSLAMGVARNLGSEDSASCPSSASALGHDANSSSITDGNLSGSDLAVLLEAAVTLCSLAAKPMQAGGKATGKGAAAGGKSPLPSLDSMTQPFIVIRDLLRGVASICPAEHLGKNLDILNGSELVLAVYQRVEGAVEESLCHRTSNSDSVTALSTAAMGEFKISESVFARDGILMTPGPVLGLVLRYSAAEVRRRVSATAKNICEGKEEIASDLEDLVCALQRSENHMLAVRVLLSSWYLSDAKAQLLRSSLLSLSRKVLSYREIDTSLAVACLVMLPYDAMVRELKGAMPSIQSDFSRLRTVASVGEELARLWDQEGLLVIFQGLQTNAKWWHVLALTGVKIDPRAFQSSDPVQRDLCVRAVVPELLERSGMDLEQTIDYCRQFDVEPEFATLCYVERILVQVPKGVHSGNILACNDTTWARQVRKAAMNIEEKTLLRTLRALLPRIHPLDYEKIRFVTTWIVSLLEEEVEMEQEITSKRELSQEKIGSEKKKRTASYGEKASEEAESCRKYTDIVTYLAGVSFPHAATRILSSAISERRLQGATSSDLSGSAVQSSADRSECSCYNEVPAMYQSRIPFWTLLSDPWLVISPLLTAAPEAAAKLQPVCRALNIDKDDFASKRIMAAYDRISGESGVLTENLYVTADDAAYVLAVEFLPAVGCVSKRVQLWHWLYSKEREKKKDSNAMKFLVAGLGEINAYKAVVRARNVQLEEDTAVAATITELMVLRDAMTAQLINLKCEKTLKSLDDSTRCLFASSAGKLFVSSFSALLLPHVEEPSLLLRKALTAAVEVAWDAQLWTLRALGCEILCSQEVPQRPLAPVVLAFLRKVGESINSIAAHTQFVADAAKPATGSDSAVPTASGVGGAESLRHGMIGKMLADVDTSGTSAGKDGSSSGTGASSSNPLGAGLWSQLEETTLRVGSAELRRREDVYLGFCIAALVACCEECSPGSASVAGSVPVSAKGAGTGPSATLAHATGSSPAPPPVTSKRATYIMQLQAVVLGKGAKSQRRLTIRSRLRAAFALQLISTNADCAARRIVTSAASPTTVSSAPTPRRADETGSNGDSTIQLESMIPFLECLAELQETRLPCSEEALMDALGSPPSISSTFPSSSSSSSLIAICSEKDKEVERTDVRVLVRTWLHDEGSHQEVVELARDLLLSARVLETSAWEGLLRHMAQRSMTRSFVQTLVLLARLSPLPLGRILTGPLRESVLSTVCAFSSEVVEKAEQVAALFKSRDEESQASYSDPSLTESASLSSSRVVLVERCHSSYEWEEAPEDLALSLSQLSLLWVAIASCGGQGQGAQRVGSQLIRIVSRSVANAPDPTLGGKKSRGVDQMVRRHAEACAFILLKISSPSPSPSPRCEAASAADSSFVTTLLESALPSGSRDGLVAAPEGRSASKSEADKFLWRVLRTCCTAYPCQLVRSALEAVCTPLNSQSSDVLRILLSSASDSWHLDGDNRVATLLLLSWCISASTSSGGVDIATSDRGADCAVGSRLVPAPTTGRDAVSSALNALSSSQKKSLNLAVSLLSSQLSSADRSLLGNIF